MAGTEEVMNSDEFESWVKSLHAADQYGPDDEIGTLNYLDPEARQRGRAAIRSGLSVGLGADLQTGPTLRDNGQSAFELEVFKLSGGSGVSLPEGTDIQMDRVEMECHGPVNTHLDALNHMGFFGTWFDGSPNSTMTAKGSVLAIARHGIFTRGVYVDVAQVRGTPYLEPGSLVTGDDIDESLEASGITFMPGDALILDCGRDRFEDIHGPWIESNPRPGCGPGAAAWVEQHKPSLVCWDMLDGSAPEMVEGSLHYLNWAIGLVLIDNCNFTAARSLLRDAGTVVGALVASPLPISGATGCNVNPSFIV